MREYKILFTGAVGAGKTTAIATLSDLPPVETEVTNSDASIDKVRTTVGLDFGAFALGNGDRVRLFGTPGQARFDFLWHVLARDALGLVILCNNARPDPLAELQPYLNGFAAALKALPCVIGVSRPGDACAPSLDDYADLLHRRGLTAPVLSVDVRQRADVTLLIDMLLVQLEADLQAVHA